MKKVNMRKALLSAVIGYFAAGGQGVLAQQDEGEEGLEWALEEVVVTATKRATSLNDTAISVAAIGSEEISRKNLAEMNDYLRTMPGVNFIEHRPANPQVVIRGLTTNAQADIAGRAATGIYFGDVPLNGSIGEGLSNLRMVDLERVEVLRGPQGTLFGAGTFAGAVRNIPNAPVLNEFNGSVKATNSETTGTGSDNHKLESVVNIPLIEDALALRAVAYRHEDSGYIENIAGTILAEDGEIFGGRPVSDYVGPWGGAELYQNHSDVGRITRNGGRVSLLWQATEDLKATLTHVYQKTEQDGQSYVELSNAQYSDTPYVQSTATFAGSDFAYTAAQKSDTTDMDANLTSLALEYDFGWANLYSSSAWLDRSYAVNRDLTGFYGFPVTSLHEYEPERFVQEVRLTSQLEGPFQYLLGAYYDEADQEHFLENSALTSEVANGFGARLTDGSFGGPVSLESINQTAYFGELSYDLTEQLELTVGGRYFEYTQSIYTENTRARDGFVRVTRPYAEFTESGAVYKVNLSYRPNDDMLFYALWSQGFRLGGLNPLLPDDAEPQINTVDANNDGILDGTSSAYSQGYDSDRTDNYELGAKLSLLDQRLQVNASFYRVDWTDIPVQLVAEGRRIPATLADPITFHFVTLINGGEARSEGFELEATYQLTSNLRASLGGAYTNAELLTDIPEINAVSGDRLANAPKVSYNLGLLYEDEFAGYPWFISADYAHVGDFYAFVAERGVEAGDYSELRMSAGVTFNQFEVELFGQNLTNEDALTHLDNGTFFDSRAYIMRPRTLGLNARYRF